MRVLLEAKSLLRRHIKTCDVCQSKRFDFRYDSCIEGLIWMRCKYCGRVLYLGSGEDLGWIPKVVQIKKEIM